MVDEVARREVVGGGVVGDGELVPVLRDDSEDADWGLEDESWSGMNVRGVTLGAKVKVGVTEEGVMLRSCLTGGMVEDD